MKISVLAFGIAKDIFGAGSIAIEMQSDKVSDIKHALEAQYPRLKQLASYMVAVNNEYANDEVIIRAIDEIAIIPPVSGG